MTKKVLMLFVCLLSFMATLPLKAGVSSYLFGDYYYVLSHSNPDWKDLNGFWIRRIYLTYDADISDKIKARARLEMNNEGKFGTTELTLTPYVKDAYVAYQFAPLHSFILGMQESLTFNTIEKFYGYRYLEKTMFDLYKIRSSRDFGITLKGNFDKNKKLGYALMFSNSSGYKEEINKYKAVTVQFNLTPNSNWFFEINGDYVTHSASKTSSLFQGFAGYQSDLGRIGFNYGRQNIKEDGKSDVHFGVLSTFLVGKLSYKIEALIRYDITFDPQVNGQDSFLVISKGYKTSLFICGLAWNIHPRFQIMPNVKLVSYKKNDTGMKPDNYTQFNITFYYQF